VPYRIGAHYLIRIGHWVIFKVKLDPLVRSCWLASWRGSIAIFELVLTDWLVFISLLVVLIPKDVLELFKHLFSFVVIP
jgi:hypothetical protein